ncbi:hypothetical protein [Aquamicrobium defluvii]|uniref:hypothetical protein n=1 Tax=Aquamicrobium defluvii TaxID=69279 RepID=UPI0012EBEC74|nr:hypothetical protein [Aquamicrobium defluvii]
MTKHTRPFFTSVRNDIPVPERKRPGIKPYDADEQFIEMAINGINTAKYKSVNDAAHLIATEISTDRNYDAIKKRLTRKISSRLK